MDKLNKVINYFKKQGFNCISQEAFPEILAWTSLKDAEGKTMEVPIHLKESNKNNVIVPFAIMGVTLKKPLKKQMVLIQQQLGSLYSSLAVARIENKDIVIDIMGNDRRCERGTTGYIG